MWNLFQVEFSLLYKITNCSYSYFSCFFHYDFWTITVQLPYTVRSKFDVWMFIDVVAIMDQPP